MFNLFAAFAEFERNLIKERSATGREHSICVFLHILYNLELNI